MVIAWIVVVAETMSVSQNLFKQQNVFPSGQNTHAGTVEKMGKEQRTARH